MVAWHLIRTKSGKEKIVRSQLIFILPEILMPLLKTTVRRWGRRAKFLAPLFPCYVFARFDLELEYRKVKYTSGVRELVCAGNDPLTVPEHIIEALKRRCSDGPVEISPPPLRSGDCVRVTEGPFRGFEAIFERYLSGPERIAILLSSLERLKPRVVLRADAVESIEERRGTYRIAD